MNFDFKLFVKIFDDLFVESACFMLNGACNSGFDDSHANIEVRACDHSFIYDSLISGFLQHILSDILLLLLLVFH